jgi:hypothetical protein
MHADCLKHEFTLIRIESLAIVLAVHLKFNYRSVTERLTEKRITPFKTRWTHTLRFAITSLLKNGT